MVFFLYRRIYEHFELLRSRYGINLLVFLDKQKSIHVLFKSLSSYIGIYLYLELIYLFAVFCFSREFS